MWVISVFIARDSYPAPLPGPIRPYWPHSHAITTSPFAAPPRVTGCTPNPPQTPTSAALTYYKHLGVRVYRWKHAKSGSGTIRTPTINYRPTHALQAYTCTKHSTSVSSDNNAAT
jgi:hypothetical protein